MWLNYTGQSTDQLLGVADRFRTDSIVVAFDAAIQQKASRNGGDSLSRAERTVVAIEALERDVNNDGFDGLFRFSASIVADLVPSLIAIGRDDVAELAASAIAELRIDGPPTEEAIVSALDDEDRVDEREARLNALDEAYYRTAGDLAEPLLAYIAAHRDEIVLP